jgi:hypothetical protein
MKTPICIRSTLRAITTEIIEKSRPNRTPEFAHCFTAGNQSARHRTSRDRKEEQRDKKLTDIYTGRLLGPGTHGNDDTIKCSLFRGRACRRPMSERLWFLRQEEIQPAVLSQIIRYPPSNRYIFPLFFRIRIPSFSSPLCCPLCC